MRRLLWKAICCWEERRLLYRKRAGRYDLALWIYRFCGFRIDHYRRQTVAALGLRSGDTVVDLACGTGLNLGLLERAVGPTGTVIGVDLTDAMLAVAKRRMEEAGWQNVELVQADLSDYTVPEGVGGILSTLALTLVPEYERVVEGASHSLRPGGRMAILDMKRPDQWPEWLVRLATWLNKPYGVSLELADRHPWEVVWGCMREVEYREFYFGALYLSVGEVTSLAQRDAPKEVR
ncbi:MAG: methyltransferase domain-containing protein [Gemmatimonadota bacterium]